MTSISVADDQSNAYVGLEVYSPVQKNSQDPLVTVDNNTATDFTATLSLDNCNDGTLYGPQGDTGCSVQFPLASEGVIEVFTHYSRVSDCYRALLA